MGRSVFETILGAVVLGIAGLFLGFAYSTSNVQRVQGYTVSANFPMIDGVKDGTDVRLNGVKIGSIEGLKLNTDAGPNQFLVTVNMSIRPDIKLPEDTMAMIASESLLGGKYMSLEPGIEDDFIKTDGTGRITRTQAPMRLDDLIGQVIYGQKRDSGNASAPAAGSGAAPATGAPAAGSPPAGNNAAPAPNSAPANKPAAPAHP
jgi:phospholipid/cholesterol/gamma-HCH transport system substrate-binding protein